jgi:hypothetical protein
MIFHKRSKSICHGLHEFHGADLDFVKIRGIRGQYLIPAEGCVVVLGLVFCAARLTTKTRRFPHDCEQSIGRGIVTEGLRYMGEEIDVSGTEDEASSKLKGMPTEAMLPMSGPPGPGSGPGIVTTKDMTQGSDPQFCGVIRLPVLINQQGEANAGILAKSARVTSIAEPHCDEAGAGGAKALFTVAQLRDVFPAEDSSIVAEKDHNCRMIGP